MEGVMLIDLDGAVEGRTELTCSTSPLLLAKG